MCSKVKLFRVVYIKPISNCLFLAELSLLFDSKEPYAIRLNSSSARAEDRQRTSSARAEDMRRMSSAHVEDMRRTGRGRPPCVRRTCGGHPPRVRRMHSQYPGKMLPKVKEIRLISRIGHLLLRLQRGKTCFP